jgi:cyclopropane-fatty-acyl-phospholipid synthase
MPSRYERLARRALAPSGIEPNGTQPWDPQIHDPRFYARALREGSLGLGDSYVDGWWDCKELDEFFCRILRAKLHRSGPRGWSGRVLRLRAQWLNLQSRARAFIPAEVHYDLGNDLFRATFDTRITGSCAYWKDASGLDEAQDAKHDLVCRKLGLEAGQRVLDIGCGWGAFMKFAAERYGVECVGVTVSREQVALGRELCAGLPVEFKLMDYREVEGRFDRVVSMGMFEHVGHRNHRVYFETAERVLEEDGLFLLHTIGSNVTGTHIDPWLDKHIFPNGLLPSIAQIGHAIEDLFVMEDWHNFGADYDRTLMAWFRKFDASWETLSGRYDERFYRLWKYYLLSCAGGFRARLIQLWQIVLSKTGVAGGYVPVR